MVLPVSVKCFANARSMAETSRKISSGMAPTQRGGWLSEERFVVGDSDKVVQKKGFRRGQRRVDGSSRRYRLLVVHRWQDGRANHQ